MKAVEVRGKIDHSGKLVLEQPLDIKNKEVRIIILISGNDDISDDGWLQTIPTNNAFEFLNEEDELYSVTDGEPFLDEV